MTKEIAKSQRLTERERSDILRMIVTEGVTLHIACNVLRISRSQVVNERLINEEFSAQLEDAYEELGDILAEQAHAMVDGLGSAAIKDMPLPERNFELRKRKLASETLIRLADRISPTFSRKTPAVKKAKPPAGLDLGIPDEEAREADDLFTDD